MEEGVMIGSRGLVVACLLKAVMIPQLNHIPTDNQNIPLYNTNFIQFDLTFPFLKSYYAYLDSNTPIRLDKSPCPQLARLLNSTTSMI